MVILVNYGKVVCSDSFAVNDERKFSTQKCYVVMHAVSVVYYLKMTIQAPKNSLRNY